MWLFSSIIETKLTQWLREFAAEPRAQDRIRHRPQETLRGVRAYCTLLYKSPPSYCVPDPGGQFAG